MKQKTVVPLADVKDEEMELKREEVHQKMRYTYDTRVPITWVKTRNLEKHKDPPNDGKRFSYN